MPLYFGQSRKWRYCIEVRHCNVSLGIYFAVLRCVGYCSWLHAGFALALARA